MGDHDQRARAGRPGARPARRRASTSRWLVGSSRTSRSCVARAAARPARTRRRSPPDSPPTGAVEADAGERAPSTTSRMRGVGGPLVVGRAAERPASRTVCASGRASSRWCEVRRRAARRSCVTRPVSGASRPVEQPQQRGLAVAVAADDADPLALADAEARRRRAAVRTPYALATPLEVDEVGGHASAVASDDAGAGDRAVRHAAPTGRSRPRSARRRRPSACSGVAARNDDASGRSRRPAPPSAPALVAGARASAQLRAQRAARRPEVVVQRGAERVGVAGAQRGHQRVGHPRLAAARRRRAAGRTRRRPRASTARRRRSRPPSRSGPRASTGRQHARRGRCRARCRRPARTARRCRARRRARAARVAGQAGPPERVAGDQRGGRVGAAAGHARRRPGCPCRCADRDAAARRRGRSASSRRGARPRGWSPSSGTPSASTSPVDRRR